MNYDESNSINTAFLHDPSLSLDEWTWRAHNGINNSISSPVLDPSIPSSYCNANEVLLYDDFHQSMYQAPWEKPPPSIEDSASDAQLFSDLESSSVQSEYAPNPPVGSMLGTSLAMAGTIQPALSGAARPIEVLKCPREGCRTKSIFRRQHELTKHVQTHDKTNICSVCKNRYSKNELKRHENTHKPKLPCPVPNCEYRVTYGRWDHLRIHLMDDDHLEDKTSAVMLVQQVKRSFK